MNKDFEKFNAKSTKNSYSFENYIVSASNKSAFTAAYDVATNPASIFNPLYIYGEPGVGKTHLLNAITNSAIQFYPNWNIVLIETRYFVDKYVKAIIEGQPEVFVEKLYAADILLIDNIQSISGKEAFSELFFEVINYIIRHRQKQVILTSDCAPDKLQFCSPRLTARFEEGLIVKIESPDLELKNKIVRNEAYSQGLILRKEDIDEISNSSDSTYRLKGLVKTSFFKSKYIEH